MKSLPSYIWMVTNGNRGNGFGGRGAGRARWHLVLLFHTPEVKPVMVFPLSNVVGRWLLLMLPACQPAWEVSVAMSSRCAKGGGQLIGVVMASSSHHWFWLTCLARNYPGEWQQEEAGSICPPFPSRWLYDKLPVWLPLAWGRIWGCCFLQDLLLVSQFSGRVSECREEGGW